MKRMRARIPVSMLLFGVPLFACGIAPYECFAGAAAHPSAATTTALADDERQTFYALGVLISRNLDDFRLTPDEFERVKAGLSDGFEKRATQVNLAVDTPKVQSLRQSRMAEVVKKRQEDGQNYLDEVAAGPKSKKTASGLVLVAVKPGSGASPGKDAEVSVKYQGKLIDGTVFDASTDVPKTFRLDAVIPCWSEALPLMKVGEKARIVCPPTLAYGLLGSPPKIASQSTLEFDVELVGISAGPGGAQSSAGQPSHAAAQSSRLE